MSDIETPERRLEKWHAIKFGRTVDLRLNRVGEWSVTLNEDRTFIAAGVDTFLDTAVTQALAAAALV